jgi:hypothetical protein
VKLFEKSGDRTGPSGAGAVDDDEGSIGAPEPPGDGHERQRSSVSASPKWQRAAEGADRRPGAAVPSIRREHDLSEASPGRREGQSQTSRAALRAGEAAGGAWAAII